MSSKSKSETIKIIVNRAEHEVYSNQTVLQSLLQIEENVQHICSGVSHYYLNNKICDCAVKVEKYSRSRFFKACLAPVELNMVIKIDKVSCFYAPHLNR